MVFVLWDVGVQLAEESWMGSAVDSLTVLALK